MAKNRTLISRYMHFFMMGKIALVRAVVKRNTISIIKKSPRAFGGYTDIHCDWHAARQSQPFQNSRVEQLLLNPPVNPWIEALSHLRHYLRFLVDQYEQNSEREVLVSLSLLDPLSCDRTGGCPRMPLFTQFSYLLTFTWHFILNENVFTFKRKYIDLARAKSEAPINKFMI